MSRKFWALAAAVAGLCLSLVACDKRQSLGFREPLKQTRDDKTFTMTLELVSDDRIVELCTSLGTKYKANGCTVFNLTTKHCTVYVAPQRFSLDEDRLAILGHEVWHCRFGEWHE